MYLYQLPSLSKSFTLREYFLYNVLLYNFILLPHHISEYTFYSSTITCQLQSLDKLICSLHCNITKYTPKDKLLDKLPRIPVMKTLTHGLFTFQYGLYNLRSISLYILVPILLYFKSTIVNAGC